MCEMFGMGRGRCAPRGLPCRLLVVSLFVAHVSGVSQAFVHAPRPASHWAPAQWEHVLCIERKSGAKADTGDEKCLPLPIWEGGQGDRFRDDVRRKTPR